MACRNVGRALPWLRNVLAVVHQRRLANTPTTRYINPRPAFIFFQILVPPSCNSACACRIYVSTITFYTHLKPRGSLDGPGFWNSDIPSYWTRT